MESRMIRINRNKSSHKRGTNFFFSIKSLEKIMKQEQYEVGDFVQFTDPGIDQYLHKKSVKRANVWKKRGFLGTYVLEDAYEKRILDFYASEEIDPITKELNYINIAYVEYYGDKDEVSFEDLEGRRYYFRRLLEKVIASAYSWQLIFYLIL